MSRIIKSQTLFPGNYYITDAKLEPLCNQGGNMLESLFADDGTYNIVNTTSSWSAGFTKSVFDVESGEIGIFNDIGSAKIDQLQGVFFNVDKEFQVFVYGYEEGCRIQIVTQMLDG